MKDLKVQSIALVQQLLLFLFLIQWPLYLPGWCYFLIFLLLLPALFAVYLQRRQFKVSPAPKEEAILFTHGPYKLIRHPMYLSLILGLLIPLIYSPNFLRALTYVLLVIVILVKIHVEEKLLVGKFSEYEEYRRRTKKLIPLLY